MLAIRLDLVEAVKTAATQIGEVFEALRQQRDHPVCRATRIVKLRDALLIDFLLPLVDRIDHAAGEIDFAKTRRGVIFQSARREVCAVGMADAMHCRTRKKRAGFNIEIHEPFDFLPPDPGHDEGAHREVAVSLRAGDDRLEIRSVRGRCSLRLIGLFDPLRDTLGPVAIVTDPVHDEDDVCHLRVDGSLAVEEKCRIKD
jgi:hypothetical protein